MLHGEDYFKKRGAGRVLPGFNVFQEIFHSFGERRLVYVNIRADDGHGQNHTLEHLKATAEMVGYGHFLRPTADPRYANLCRRTYPSIKYISLDNYDPPPGIKIILRSHLVEVGRLKDGVDVCIRDLGAEERLVFKYYYTGDKAKKFWKEVSVLLALPAGLPGVLPIKHLVLDETTNDGVVGFTSPFMAGGNLGNLWLHHPNYPVRLEWFRQLMAVVDLLNLEYNVCHSQVTPRTVLLDGTEKVYLCRFGRANPMHTQRAKPMNGEAPFNSLDDVKGVILTVFSVLTGNRKPIRDLNFGDYDRLIIQGRQAWVLGDSVRLEDGVTVDQIYDEVMEWARGRCSSATDEVHALKLRGILWKPFPGREYQLGRMAMEKCPKPDGGGCTYEDEFCGEVLDWTRPGTLVHMPPGRRLLATRKYEHEGAPPYKRVCLGRCAASQSDPRIIEFARGL